MTGSSSPASSCSPTAASWLSTPAAFVSTQSVVMPVRYVFHEIRDACHASIMTATLLVGAFNVLSST